MSIPYYDSYHGEKKLALLDNSSVEFLMNLQLNGKEVVDILLDYDAVFIPRWVMNEISDSPYRVDFLEDMLEKKAKLYLIEERQFSVTQSF